MDLLWAEMSVLKHLRDDVARRGERKMEKWIQNVDAQAREVNNLRKEISEIRKGGCPSKSRLEIHKKVIEILGVVAELKRIGNCNVLEHRIGASAILGGNDIQRNGDGRSTETVERFLSNIAREKPHRFSSKDIKNFTSNFALHLGRGGYGEVYKGQFPNGVEIAVKVLKENARDVVKKQFMAEVGTMGRTYHRNLVRLYGYCFDANMKALVYEFMEKGSLDNILYENRFKLEWGKLYDIATETAKGLSYLHENCHKRIIHCDIKAGNVLIDSNLCPKVADFGLAKLCNRDLSHFTLSHFRGTPGYAAPEVWMPLPVTYKCDVYSFGMMLFEILGRKKNYNRNLGEGQKWFPGQVWEKFENGQLEEVMRDCGIEAKDREKAMRLSVVALWCSQYVPQNRPSMSTVVKILEGEIQAADPPNPFPHMVSSSAASMVTIESSKCVSSFLSSEGGSIKSRVPISFSCVSSEDSTVFPEWQVVPKSPLPEPTVPTEKKHKEAAVVSPEEKKQEVVTVVLMVYMHCEACAQEVAKYVQKMKGVKNASTNLERSQVTVKGVINPQQLVEYVYKKTNKRAMIVKVETGKADVPKAIAEAEVKLAIEHKSENKTNKWENVEDSIAIARTEWRKKQERAVAETKLEKKPSKQVVTEMEEDEKEIVHMEQKNKQQNDGAASTNPTKRREERKERAGGGVVGTKLEKRKEEIKEDNKGFVKPKHEKITQVKKEQEKGSVKTILDVKEAKATLVSEKEEEEVPVKPNAKKHERDRVKEMQNIWNFETHMKEIQEELEEEVIKEDDKDKENLEEEKVIREVGSERETQRKENAYYEHSPPQYRYVQRDNVQRNNEYYHDAYAPQLFSDDNPNAWCSIQ